MSIHDVRWPIQRSLGLLLVAALLAFVPQLAIPRPVAACSCIAAQPLAQYAKDGSVIISGRVIGRDAVGVQVAVDRWFAGSDPARGVWITGDFGNGASCGVGSEPPMGTEWIWVAWRPEGEPGLSISICAPIADLSTPAGQELLAEARQTFGDIGVDLPLGGGPVDDPEPTAEAGGQDDQALIVVAAALGAGVLVLAGVALLARRRQTA